MAVFRHRPGSARCPMKMYAIFARYRADHDRRWRTSRAMVGAVFFGGDVSQAGACGGWCDIFFVSKPCLVGFYHYICGYCFSEKTGLLWKNGMYGL